MFPVSSEEAIVYAYNKTGEKLFTVKLDLYHAARPLRNTGVLRERSCLFLLIPVKSTVPYVAVRRPAITLSCP